MRSDVVRWIAVVLITPILVLGAISRATFRSHCHDEHGMHLHAVVMIADGMLTAAGHADDHGHGHAALGSDSRDGGEHVCHELGKVPCCLIICFNAHKQLPTRTVGFKEQLSRAAMFAMAVVALPPYLGLNLSVGLPGGALNGGPMDLLALRAGDRLVRTSRALLI